MSTTAEVRSVQVGGQLLRVAELDPAIEVIRFDPPGVGGSAPRIAAAMHDGNRVGPPGGYLYQLTAGAGWTSVPFLPWLRQRGAQDYPD